MRTWISVIVFALAVSTAHAQCRDGSMPDNITRAGDYGVCLAIDSFTPPGTTADAPIVVYLHGMSRDGVVNLTKGSINLLDWLKNIGREHKVTTIFLQRPGFSSTLGKSEGFEGRKEREIYNWTTHEHLAYIAVALNKLRQANPNRPILLAGHSAGALLTGLITAHYSQLVDAAVMSACPCDLRTLYKLPPSQPLSPDPYRDYKLIPDSIPVIALTGDKDVDTPAEQGRGFIELLQKNGSRNASFVLAAGHTHFTIRPDSKELPEAIRTQIEFLRKKTVAK